MKLLATFCAFVLGQWILPPNYGYIHATIIGVASAGLVFGTLSVLERKDGK